MRPTLVILLLLLAAFLVSRIVFLDRDMPSFRVTQLQPIDEFFYTIPAFNLYHYGSMTHQAVPFIATDGAPLNLVQNLLTWLTLALFGNNYYGLRMASVAAGLLVAVLLFAVLRREARATAGPEARWLTTVLPFLWLAYLTADFAFNTAARAAEPTIFRMLGMAALLFTASAWRESGSRSALRAFCFGFLAVSLCVYIYFYNAFLIPAVLLTILFETFGAGWRRAALSLVAASAGCLLALGSYAAVVYVTYGESLLELYRRTIEPLQSRVGTGSLRVSLPENLFAILSTNIFRFDLPLLVAFGVALPILGYRVYRERSSFGFLVGALLFFLFLQSEFAADYPYRKLVMLSPLVVLVIALGVTYVRPFLTALRAHRVGFVALIGWLTVCEFCVYAVYLKEHNALGSTFRAVSLLCIVLLTASIAATYMGDGRLVRTFTTLGMAALIVPGLYMSTQQLFLHPTFRYRDAMIAAAPLLNHQITAGEFSFAFRLYNSSVPVLSYYQYLLLPGGESVYVDDLRRIFGGGYASYTVANLQSKVAHELALQTVATYEIDAEQTPLAAIFKSRSGP